MSAFVGLLDFLETVPPPALDHIYESEACCLLVFRWLPSLAQYVVLRLLLLNGPVPFGELRSWHPPSQKPLQNRALLKLKQLSVLQGKDGEVWMNAKFQGSMRRAFGSPEGGKDGGKYGGKDSGKDSNRDSGKERWEHLLCLLATNGGDQSTLDLQIFVDAGLASRERGHLSITKTGFQFLLADTSTQLWTIAIQHFALAVEGGGDVVELVKLVAMLATSSGPIQTRLRPFAKQLVEYGLAVQKGDRLFPTQLAALLHHRAAEEANRPSPGFLVVETNYKIYAYTASPLHIAILGLFVRLKDRFPNMVYGQLTQESVQRAYDRGITADQLVDYITSNAHPVMRRRQPVVPFTVVDQVGLWELERFRLRTKEGHLYQQFLTAADFDKAVEEARRISAVLYIHVVKRILVVSPSGHSHMKSFIRSNIPK